MSTRFSAFGFVFALVVIFGVRGQIASAEAGLITVKVDLSSQRMDVYQNDRRLYRWRVSTGRGRYRTPTGNFRPTVMKRMHYSTKYNNAPMPHSIFYRRGYAIHGTNHISRLGRPASHGCVRLHPRNAATLYNLVRRNGPRNTRIQIRY